MKILFKLIAEHLGSELALVSSIDLWNNQLSNPDRQAAILDKSIFVEFIADDVESGGNGTQLINGIIRFHILQLAYVDTVSGGKDDDGYNPFTVLEYIDEVHAALQGYSAIYIYKDANNDEVKNKMCTSMQRVSITQDTDHAAMHHWIMDYKTSITDYQAQRTRNYVSITPVAVEVEKVDWPIDRE